MLSATHSLAVRSDLFIQWDGKFDILSLKSVPLNFLTSALRISRVYFIFDLRGEDISDVEFLILFLYVDWRLESIGFISIGI